MLTSIDSVKKSCPGSIFVIIYEDKSISPSIFAARATAPDNHTAHQASVATRLNERILTLYNSGAEQYVAAFTNYRRETAEGTFRSMIDELSDGEQVKLFEEEDQDDGTVVYTDITEAPPVADTENEVD